MPVDPASGASPDDHAEGPYQSRSFSWTAPAPQILNDGLTDHTKFGAYTTDVTGSTGRCYPANLNAFECATGLIKMCYKDDRTAPNGYQLSAAWALLYGTTPAPNQNACVLTAHSDDMRGRCTAAPFVRTGVPFTKANTIEQSIDLCALHEAANAVPSNRNGKVCRKLTSAFAPCISNGWTTSATLLASAVAD
eukprot:COSAG06_NODE_2691_length_6430_cov_2.427648_4_plen_193_part_00